MSKYKCGNLTTPVWQELKIRKFVNYNFNYKLGLEYVVQPRLFRHHDKCHRRSQIFPVSFADSDSSGVLVSFITFILEEKCLFWLWEGFFERLRAYLKAKRAIFTSLTKHKNDQNSWDWQKSAQSSWIFVTSRGICQSVVGVSLRKGDHFPFWTKMVRTQK